MAKADPFEGGLLDSPRLVYFAGGRALPGFLQCDDPAEFLAGGFGKDGGIAAGTGRTTKFYLEGGPSALATGAAAR